MDNQARRFENIESQIEKFKSDYFKEQEKLEQEKYYKAYKKFKEMYY